MLIICALFFLRLGLVKVTKYLNIKLFYLPKIKFIFKSMGVLVISYIYYLLYLLCFSVISEVIILSTMCIFYFQSTFFVLGFNFLLYYWFIGEKTTSWIQRFILSRQVFFVLLAGISFGLVKLGFVIEQNILIFEMEKIFTLIVEKEVNDFDFSSSVEDRFILGAQYFWLYLFVSFVIQMFY